MNKDDIVYLKNDIRSEKRTKEEREKEKEWVPVSVVSAVHRSITKYKSGGKRSIDEVALADLLADILTRLPDEDVLEVCRNNRDPFDDIKWK